MSWNEFKAAVDRILQQKAGIRVEYIDIDALKEAYDEGIKPEQAAKEAALKDGFPEGEWK